MPEEEAGSRVGSFDFLINFLFPTLFILFQVILLQVILFQVNSPIRMTDELIKKPLFQKASTIYRRSDVKIVAYELNFKLDVQLTSFIQK